VLAVKLDALPDIDVHRILILRTARGPQVQWALDQLRTQYPSATCSVLGTQLRDNAMFSGMRQFEIQEPWLKVSSYRKFEHDIRNCHFDLAVMVLNGDGAIGYEDVSRIMKRIPAPTKLVAGFSHRWYAWNHASFSSGSFVQRWLCHGIEYVLFGITYSYMFLKSSSPSYMPASQGRTAPEYEK